MELGMCLLALLTWYWAILRPFVAASTLLAALLPGPASAAVRSDLPEILLSTDSGWLMLRDDVATSEAEHWVTGDARLEKPADVHWRVRQRVDRARLPPATRTLLRESMIGYGENARSCRIELGDEIELWHEDASWRALVGDDRRTATLLAISEIRQHRAGRLVVQFKVVGGDCDAVLWARPKSLPSPRLWYADEEAELAHQTVLAQTEASAQIDRLAMGYQKFAQAQPEFAEQSFENWLQSVEQRQLWRSSDADAPVLMHGSIGFESAPCEPRFAGGLSYWAEGPDWRRTPMQGPAGVRAHDVVAVIDLRRDGQLSLLVRGELGHGLKLLTTDSARQDSRLPSLSSEVEFYGCRC